MHGRQLPYSLHPFSTSSDTYNLSLMVLYLNSEMELLYLYNVSFTREPRNLDVQGSDSSSSSTLVNDSLNRTKKLADAASAKGW